MDIKPLAEKLAREHDTRDPFVIASSMKYVLIDAQLEGVRGFYQYARRRHIMYVDSDLPPQDRRWVCAHELGHSLLHKNLNRIFMDSYTFMTTNRFEREADRFAVSLLISDAELLDFTGCSIAQIAECYGLNYDLAEYRVRNIERKNK